MSESDKRLDPATLRHIAAELRALDPRKHAHHEVSFAAGIRDGLEVLADEAAALPPRLSDWVRACEATKLGPFTLGQTKNGLAFFFGEDGHEWIVDFHPDLTMAFIEKVDDCEAYTCDTPAELMAALDRLAEDASRG